MAEENTKKNAMQDKQPEKMSYEDLVKTAKFFKTRCDQMEARINQDMEYIASLETQNLFNYLKYLFKAVDCPMLSSSVVEKSVADIEEIMSRLHTIMVPKEKEEVNDTASAQAE